MLRVVSRFQMEPERCLSSVHSGERKEDLGSVTFVRWRRTYSVVAETPTMRTGLSTEVPNLTRINLSLLTNESRQQNEDSATTRTWLAYDPSALSTSPGMRRQGAELRGGALYITHGPLHQIRL